jgi:hypothetical protein
MAVRLAQHPVKYNEAKKYLVIGSKDYTIVPQRQVAKLQEQVKGLDAILLQDARNAREHMPWDCINALVASTAQGKAMVRYFPEKTEDGKGIDDSLSEYGFPLSLYGVYLGFQTPMISPFEFLDKVPVRAVHKAIEIGIGDHEQIKVNEAFVNHYKVRRLIVNEDHDVVGFMRAIREYEANVRAYELQLPNIRRLREANHGKIGALVDVSSMGMVSAAMNKRKVRRPKDWENQLIDLTPGTREFILSIEEKIR